MTVSSLAVVGWKFSKRCTAPRGMTRTWPGPTPVTFPSTVKVSMSEGEHAFETIGGFFIAIMTVSTGDFAAGGHVEFEHGDGIFCFVPLNEKADRDAANFDLVLG